MCSFADVDFVNFVDTGLVNAFRESIREAQSSLVVRFGSKADNQADSTIQTISGVLDRFAGSTGLIKPTAMPFGSSMIA